MKKGQSHVEASPLFDKLVFSKVAKFFNKILYYTTSEEPITLRFEIL
jgi:hypothetical protein